MLNKCNYRYVFWPCNSENRDKGELIEQSPKSNKERQVPIVKALRPYLREAMTDKGPDDLVFSGPRSGRIVAKNFRRFVDWERIRKELRRPDLRVHDLRHTFATILFDAGASAPDVQAVLGHSSLQVTEHYSRAREGVAKRAGNVFDSLSSGRVNGTNMAQTREGPRL